MAKKFKLGIDLGGTKIEIVVLDGENKQLYRKRVPTPSQSYKKILNCIAELVASAEKDMGLGSKLALGIGTPGALSTHSGLLQNSNTVVMNGKPLVQDLHICLAREVRIQNDANCFTLSEASSGAAVNHKVVFGIIIGTGVGGALVVDGKLLSGAHAIAGEWGHNPLPWGVAQDGPTDCYCGKQACIETFLSGPGLANSYRHRFGQTLSSEQIVAAAQRGETNGVSMMQRYYDQMAGSIAQLINIIDPHAIVLGGGMSNIDALYDEIPKRLGAYVFADRVDTPILKAQHGDSSGVLGAAMLWDD